MSTRRLHLLLLATLLLAGCGSDIVLEGRDGTRLTYDCGSPEWVASTPAEYGALKDVATRIVRESGEPPGEVEAWLTAYADPSSGALERLVVGWACEHGVPAVVVAAFPQVGARAPEVALPVFEGGGPGADSVVLGEARRPVMLYFWATWCAPCVAAWPEVVGEAERITAAGGLAVGIPFNDDPDALARYLAEHGSDAFPQLWDGDGAVAEAYRIRGVPMKFALDADMRVLPACDTCRYAAGGGARGAADAVLRALGSTP